MAAPHLRLPLSEQGTGVKRYADVNNLNRFVMSLLYHNHRAKVAEKGEKNGNDTHKKAWENMVVLV